MSLIETVPGPRDIWLVASAVHGRDVHILEPYPHICGRMVPGAAPIGKYRPRYKEDQCLACAESALDEELAHTGRRGNDGHACGPAGRGTVEDRWTCPECAAKWKRIRGEKAGVTTLTWERAA